MDGFFGLIDTWATALSLAVAMLAAWGAGWWLGRRRSAGGNAPAGKFDDASLALLGLLLAFTFSMALGKHDQRRISLVADSNAIGDFYTSASMLSDPLRTQLQTVIREYTELRLAAVAQRPDLTRRLSRPCCGACRRCTAA